MGWKCFHIFTCWAFSVYELGLGVTTQHILQRLDPVIRKIWFYIHCFHVLLPAGNEVDANSQWCRWLGHMPLLHRHIEVFVILTNSVRTSVHIKPASILCSLKLTLNDGTLPSSSTSEKQMAMLMYVRPDLQSCWHMITFFQNILNNW